VWEVLIRVPAISDFKFFSFQIDVGRQIEMSDILYQFRPAGPAINVILNIRSRTSGVTSEGWCVRREVSPGDKIQNPIAWLKGYL
jgi:hypothetical protein